MSELKTSILLELQDKFSKQFKDLQKQIEGTEEVFKDLQKAMNTTSKSEEKVSRSFKGIIKDFITGGKELDAFKKKLNNVGEGYQELAKIVGLDITGNKIKKFFSNNISEASNRQKLDFDLSTVLKGKSSEGIKNVANTLAEQGLSSYHEAMETGYALLSAGISESETEVGISIASKVALLTKGHAEEIANVMATASKDFKLSMQETGDILAKTQNIFQIKDFQQLEEGLKYVSASASSLNIPLAQAASLVGILNDAGQTGSMAGIGVANVLAYLGKASKVLEVEVPKAKDGSLDVIKWVGLVQSKLQKVFGKDDLGKYNALQKAFGGTEGSRAFMTVQLRFKDLLESHEKLANTKGFINNQSVALVELFSIKLEGLENALSHLSGSLGVVLLPSLTYFVDKLSQGVAYLAKLVDNSKSLAWIVNIVAGVLGILVARMLILRAIAIADFIFGFSKALLFARSAIMLTVGAMNFLKLAMLSNPITAIMLGIATLATLIVMNWDSVKAWFVGFFDWLSDNGFFKLVSKGIEMAKSLIGGDNNISVSNEGVKKVKEANMIGGNTSSHNTHNNQTYHINVSGAVNPTDTAKEVNKEIENQHQLSMVGG